MFLEDRRSRTMSRIFFLMSTLGEDNALSTSITMSLRMSVCCAFMSSSLPKTISLTLLSLWLMRSWQ